MCAVLIFIFALNLALIFAKIKMKDSAKTKYKTYDSV